MAPDPPVLSQSESKIWLDFEWCVYDQSTNSGRLLVGTTIEVVGMKSKQFGRSGDNAQNSFTLTTEKNYAKLSLVHRRQI